MKSMKNIYMALPIVAAMLLIVACNNQALDIIDESQPDQVRLIPYTATVGSDIPTRVTLSGVDDGVYLFETGDKLYVWGENIKGELTLTSGNGSYEANFSGDLKWSGGSEEPASNLDLNAVIVNSNNSKMLGTLDQLIAGVDYPNYSLAPLAANLQEAVQYCSYFKTTSTYGAKSFYFQNKQKTAFLCFDITLENGATEIAAGSVDVNISKGGITVYSGPVPTEYSGGYGGSYKSSFVASFPEGFELNNETTVTLGSGSTRVPISFGGDKTLAANGKYEITRKYYTITASSASTTMTRIAPMSYALTTTQILNGLGVPAQAASFVSGCTDPDPAGVVYVDTDSKPYVFTIIGEGTTSFTLSTTVPGFESIPVSITVAK